MLAVAAAELNRTPGVIVPMADPHVCAPIDANGNLTSDGTRTFEWTARNEIASVTNAGTEYRYFYDGLRRMGGIVERYMGSTVRDESAIWCDEGQCEDRETSTGSPLRRIFNHGERTSNDRLKVRDHLGAISAVSDASASIVARTTFDPFGRRELVSGADELPIGLAGHRWQTQVGLSFATFRAFDPNLGRWLSEDPAGFIEGLNLYRYVSNRPVSRSDPSGLCSCNSECKSGDWQVDSYTGTVGGIGLTFSSGYAVVKCKGNSSVNRRALVQCYTWGQFGIGSVDVNFQMIGTAISGPCNKSDLPAKFTTKAWVLALGPLSLGTDGAGAGFGAIFGLGRTTCHVYPI